jgi:hypothetical protein
MNFRQRDGESLCESWKRLKELLRICPHHGLEEWIIIQTFYDSLNDSTRMSIVAAAGGAFANRSVDDVLDLIENMALNQS